MERIWYIHPRTHHINNTTANNARLTHHTNSSILYRWSTPHTHDSMIYMATAGLNGNVYVWSVDHILLHTMSAVQQALPTDDTPASPSHDSNTSYALPANTHIAQLEWSADGHTLAILTNQPHNTILLLHMPTHSVINLTDTVDLSTIYKDMCIIQWSKVGQSLAIGTNKGELALISVDASTHMPSVQWCIQRHKKRILCIDFNNSGKVASAGDDRQISVTNTADGKIYGQVKVKSRPTSIKFGGNAAHADANDNIVSVSMDRKTILLYNLNDAENALELAFQSRYGSIVSFTWFNQSYIMVAFTLGYLVVISTQIEQIGREQFCARFHRDGLREISYSQQSHQLICCSDYTMKRIDMYTWCEINTIEIERQLGAIESCDTTQNGNIVSVVTNKAYVLVYAIDTALIPNTNALVNVNNSLKLLVNKPIDASTLMLYCCVAVAFLLFIASYTYNETMYDLVLRLYHAYMGHVDVQSVINSLEVDSGVAV